MTLTIKNLVITNFKLFEYIELTIESNRLIVLDGPNGFGKSSFFDALELLLTGTIRRYVELEELTVDGRSQKSGCPWLFNKAKVGSWLSIRAEIEIGGKIRFLERAFSKLDLDKQKGLKALKLPLYELTAIDAERVEAVSDENSYLSNILGREYKRDFELFHYVEQEENVRLLKQKEKDRQLQIAHLFEIGQIQQKINNISNSIAKIGKLCNKSKEDEINTLNAKCETAKQQIFPDGEPVEYKRLISITQQAWDQEITDYAAHEFKQWLSPEGELFHLRRFVEHFSQYENHIYNQNIVTNLLPKIELQKRLLMFAHHASNKENMALELQRYDDAVKINNAFKDLVNAIKQDQLILPKSLMGLIPDTIIQTEFETKLLQLKEHITSAGNVDESLANVVLMREQLVEAFKEYHLQVEPTEVCPTCSHRWESVEALLKGIEIQGKTLQLLSDQQNSQLSEQLSEFKQSYQIPIEQALATYQQKQKDQIAYKRQLVAFTPEQLIWLHNYKQELINVGIEFQDLLLDSFDLNAELPLLKFEQRVRSKFKPVDDSCLHPDFDDLFRKIFNKDSSAIMQVTLELIDSKTKYLRQQQSIASSTHAINCETEYKNAEQQFKSAKKLEGHLKKLKTIYTDERKKYLESIVKEIEILFHIYSGRLMQTVQQGLGIFIENDGNSIAFHETPGQNHDVVFSMSSGQLSALVLSFTLALNQRYAKHSLLLIDDPAQTLDEINVAGFIELLRTEFADRQIIISTHEERMSAYFRYKYKKFGIPTGRINFMEQARAAMESEADLT